MGSSPIVGISFAIYLDSSDFFKTNILVELIHGYFFINTASSLIDVLKVAIGIMYSKLNKCARNDTKS